MNQSTTSSIKSIPQNYCGLPLTKTKTTTTIISMVALAGIALVTTGMLSYMEIFSGLNSISQWTFVGVGFSLMVMVAIYESSKPLEKRLDDISLQQLKAKIDQICLTADPLDQVHQLAKLIPLETLEPLVKDEYKGFEGALEVSRGMLSQAQTYLQIREKLSPSVHARISSLLDTLVNVIDSLFVAFGVADFFQPAENGLHGDFKFQKIMMLISLFTLLTATLLPLFNVQTGASIVGGTLLLVAVLSLIWPHVKPLSSIIPEGENWSKQVRECKLVTLGGRKGKVKEIAEGVSGGEHLLLIGPSGIGKTQTVQAFVQALERGEFPQLAGMTVFYFNMAELASNKEMFSGGNKILQRIRDIIGRHRDKCILVLDEIHIAYQGKKGTLGNQLKTLMDVKENNFPHVIGLTTEEEYQQYIYVGQAAADRRFRKIEIETTNEQATAHILHQFMISTAPGVVLEHGALKHLIEKTTEYPQPLMAKKILTRCIEKATHVIQSQKAKDFETKQEELELQRYIAANLGSISLESEAVDHEKNQLLESELTLLEEELKKETKQLQALAQARKDLAGAREMKYRSVLKTAHLKESLSSKNKTQLSEFLLLKYFVEGALEKRVRMQAESINIHASINSSLIDEVIEVEKVELAKKKELLIKAQKQMEERKEIK